MVNVSFVIGLLFYLGAIASKILINDSYGTSIRLMTILLILGSLFLFFAYLEKKKEK